LKFKKAQPWKEKKSTNWGKNVRTVTREVFLRERERGKIDNERRLADKSITFQGVKRKDHRSVSERGPASGKKRGISEYSTNPH